jgi:predicted transposase/invertase (TIGR01784 family)
MKKRNQPHDRFLKDLLQDIEVAKEFLQNHLPLAIQENIDWDSLTLYDISIIGEGNKQLYADLVYKAKTKQERTDAFFIINHERNPNALLPFKGAEYMLGTLKKNIKQKQEPAFIFHTTWHNGKKGPYPYPQSILDYFKEKDLAQQMLLHSGQVIHAHELDDQVLASHEKSNILELFMKYGDDPNLLTWLEEHPEIAKKLEENKYIDRGLEYVAEVGCHKIEDLIDTFEKISEKLGKTMLTTAQQIERKTATRVRKSALQEGKQQGMQARNLEIAKNMLSKGYQAEAVLDLTGLSKEELENLKKAAQ